MAQACTPTVITMAGCPHCENLKSMLNSAGIKYTETTSGNCACYPCVVLCNKSTMDCCGKDESVLFNAIKTSIATAAPAPAPSTPANPSTTPTTKPTTPLVAGGAAPTWKVALWSNEVAITWGEPNPRPTVKETPLDWQHPDVQLTPILPLPPLMTTGITVALRDHKKMPKGRKIA
jgi:hypothetical protein